MNAEKNQRFLMKKEMNCGGWQENLKKRLGGEAINAL
jgi:hypothetical protein